MFLAEAFCILHDTGQIATATSTRHLPCKDFIFVCIDIALYTTLNHGREHGHLRFKGCLIGSSESL